MPNWRAAEKGLSPSNRFVSVVITNWRLAAFCWRPEQKSADTGTGLPILDAVGHGFAPIVRLLIEHGAKTQIDNSPRPLLHLAGTLCRPQVTRAVLEAGLDPNELNNEGGTALMAAAWRGDAKSVRLLLEAGAAVDSRTARPIRSAIQCSRNISPEAGSQNDYTADRGDRPGPCERCS